MLMCLSFRFDMKGFNDGQHKALERVFDDPESPFQYATPTALHRALCRTHPELGLTLKKGCEFVERCLRIHQIVQAVRQRCYDCRLTVSLRPHHQWQWDLAYFDYGKRFILTKVDVFSRLADAEVVGNKSGPAVLHGFCKIVQHLGTPRLLQTDQGKEFFNAPGLVQFGKPVDDMTRFALHLYAMRFPDFMGNCKQVVQFTKKTIRNIVNHHVVSFWTCLLTRLAPTTSTVNS